MPRRNKRNNKNIVNQKRNVVGRLSSSTPSEFVDNNSNSWKDVSNLQNMDIAMRNSVYGATSLRARGVGTRRGNPFKGRNPFVNTLQSPNPKGMPSSGLENLNQYNRKFKVGGTLENVQPSPSPRGGDGGGGGGGSRIQIDNCWHHCYGQDVYVHPGTCIMCPEMAFCVDDALCTGPHNMNEFNNGGYDLGFACCGCPSSHWLDSGGESYAKKIGSHYLTYHGDGYCDDGLEWDGHSCDAPQGCGDNGTCNCPIAFYIQTQMGCTEKENCYPLFPSYQYRNDYVNGPLCDGPGCASGSTANNTFVYPWSSDWSNNNNPTTGTADAGDLHNSGLVPIHFTCSEWGWDCGGIALDTCYGEYHGAEAGIEAALGITATHRQQMTVANPAGWDWLGNAEDPYRHCNYRRGLPATCFGKCNRQVYRDSLGFDPGGLAKTATDDLGAGESVGGFCYCNQSCPWCGCDWERMGDALYAKCIQACPGNCEDPNCPGCLEVDSWTGQVTFVGSGGDLRDQPGVNCNNGSPYSYPSGDCCGDWGPVCNIDPVYLPCDCYDTYGSPINIEESSETNPCDYPPNNGAGIECSRQVSVTEYGGGSACNGNTEVGGNCQSACSQYCDTIEMQIDPENWGSAQQSLTNNYCSMWDYNVNIMGQTNEYDPTSWSSVPYCNVEYSGHMCQSSTCMCECSTCLGAGGIDLNQFEQTPDVGCGGTGAYMYQGVILETGSSTTQACNYDDSHNCSREYIEKESSDNNQPQFLQTSEYQNAGVCIFGSEHRYMSSLNNCPRYNKSNRFNNEYEFGSGTMDDCPAGAEGINLSMGDGSNFILACMEMDYYKIYADLAPGTNVYDKQMDGCGGCPDPYAGNYTGECIYRIDERGIDLHYGRNPGNVLDELIGYPLDGDGYPVTGTFTSPGVYSNTSPSIHTELNPNGFANGGSIPNLDHCYYEVGVRNGQGFENEGARCCDSSDASAGWLCQPWDLDHSQIFGHNVPGYCPVRDMNQESCFDIQASDGQYFDYDWCKSPMGCATATASQDACGKSNVVCACCNTGACNFYDAAYNNGAGEGSDTGLWYSDGSATVACAQTNGVAWGNDCDSVTQAEVCDFPTWYCADCDGDGVSDSCTGDTSPKQVCDSVVGSGANEQYVSNCTGCITIENSILDDMGNGFPGVVCTDQSSINEDLVPNCPGNNQHDTWTDDRPCNVAPYAGQCCIAPGSEEDIGNVCLMGTVDGLDTPGYNDGSGGTYLPCCRQKDDCGVCHPIGWGIFEDDSDGGYFWQQPALCSNDDNQYLPECACPTDTYVSMISYRHKENGSFVGSSFCNCSENTVVGCEACSGQPAANHPAACGSGNINLCGSCGGGVVDDCGVCEGDTGYGVNPVDCSEQADTWGTSDGIKCDCAGSMCDCAGNCVADGHLNWSEQYLDSDGDGMCQEGSQIPWCMVEALNTNYVTLSQCSDEWDVDDNCYNDVTDECGVCGGNNMDMDCFGVCFGDGLVDDCGNCRAPASYNDAMDQCGLCPSAQGDYAAATAMTTYSSKDPIGGDITITYGSFGCETGDWFAWNFPDSETGSDRSGGTAEVIHRGCQCAGCVNPLSPAYTPHALYSSTCTQSELDSGNCNDWMCHQSPKYHTWGPLSYDNSGTLNVVTPYGGSLSPGYCDKDGSGTLGQDYCNGGGDQADWSEATKRWEVKDALRRKICPEISNDDATLSNIDCWVGWCVDESGTPNGQSCWPGLFECTSGTCSDYIHAAFQEKDWKSHGEVYWHYCENDTLGHNCDGLYSWSDAEHQECVAIHGEFCCGTASQQSHCRVGVRSDFMWMVDRSTQFQDGGDPEFTIEEEYENAAQAWLESQPQGSGDLNYDGVVDIMDLVQLVNSIMDGPANPQWEMWFADMNQDGILNIFDIITMINNILSDGRNWSLMSSPGGNQLSNQQEAELTRRLKPLFNNSTTSNMLITNQGISIAHTRQMNVPTNSYRNHMRRTSSTRRTNTTSRDGSYTITGFNFVLNAPTCLDDLTMDEVEIGENFTAAVGGTTGDWTLNNVPVGNGKILRMDETDYFTSVPIVELLSKHLFTIYRPNVHLQGLNWNNGPLDGLNKIERDSTWYYNNGCTWQTDCGGIDAGTCYDEGLLEDVCLNVYETNEIFGFSFPQSNSGPIYGSKHYVPGTGGSYCVGHCVSAHPDEVNNTVAQGRRSCNFFNGDEAACLERCCIWDGANCNPYQTEGECNSCPTQNGEWVGASGCDGKFFWNIMEVQCV